MPFTFPNPPPDIPPPTKDDPPGMHTPFGILWPPEEMAGILDKVMANQNELENLRLRLRGLHLTVKAGREQREKDLLKEILELEMGLQDLSDEMKKYPLLPEHFIPPSARDGTKPSSEKTPAPGTGGDNGFFFA